MSRTIRHHADAEDEILRDGEKLVVKMSAMDAARSRGVVVTDAHGHSDPASLSRPGFRTLQGGDERAHWSRDAKTVEAAKEYDLYEKQLCDAYKQPSQTTGFGSSGSVRGEREGDVCTIDGWPGHLRAVGNQLKCVADNPAGRHDAASKQECEDCEGTGEDDNGNDCPSCNGTGYLNANEGDDDDAAEPRIDRRTVPRHDRRSLDAITRDHQQNMEKLYAARAQEMCNAWRRGK